MIVLFEKIEEISGGRVTFYTAKLDDKELTEIEIFDDKDFPDHSEELEILYTAMDLMQIKGALKVFFKEEGAANALPIVPQSLQVANGTDYGIRLFCIRINDNIVVLLNGDIKTALKNKDCENVRQHFNNARAIAMEIDKMIALKEIFPTDRDCLNKLEIEI